MKKFFLLLGPALILLSSCSKSGDFELNIKPTFKNAPLVLNETQNLGAIDVKFENLTFYISEIALINKKGEEISLIDVDFIQLNSFDLAGAESGKSLIFRDLEAGGYEKIKFSIGVPSDLNAMSPGDFGVSEPLGRTDHFWEPWGSYIFSKIEGNADVDKDGVFDLKFFYHTGSDALFRSFEITEDIVINNNEVTKFELSIDYNEVLKQADGSYFDIPNFPRNHNPEELDIITQLVDNYLNAITYAN